MSKILSVFYLLLISLILLFIIPKPAQAAANITLGDFYFENLDASLGKVKLTATVIDSAGHAQDLPSKNSVDDESTICRLFEGLSSPYPCIGSFTIPGPSDGTETIKIKNVNVQWIPNTTGVPDDTGSFQYSVPRSANPPANIESDGISWIKAAGGSTGNVVYVWSAGTGKPLVDLSSASIDPPGGSNTKEHVTVTISDPKESTTYVSIRTASSDKTLGELAYITVSCTSGTGGSCTGFQYNKGNMTFDPGNTIQPTIKLNPLSILPPSSTYQLEFDIDSSILDTGGTYEIKAYPASQRSNVLNFVDSPLIDTKAFSVGTVPGSVQITLNCIGSNGINYPGCNFPSPDTTKGAKMTVTLGTGATSENYKITSSAPGVFLASFLCTGPGCHADLNIASTGVANSSTPTTYSVTATAILTPTHFGNQTFTVGAGVTQGACIADDPKPKKCTDLGLASISYDTDPNTCQISAKPGHQCPSNDTLCLAADGITPKCAISSQGGTCPAHCPAGFTDDKNICTGIDTTTTCCQQTGPGTFIQAPKDTTCVFPSSNATPITCGTNGISTAIGCIPTDPTTLIQSSLKVLIYASGGIALLMMAIGAIGMMVSLGNAEALKNAQARFIAAVAGLLFIVFAVLLMKIIGVDILNLPGFS